MRLPNLIHEAIIAHARFEFPNEACGLLAADETGTLRMCYTLTNADRSPVSYTVDPTEHFRSMQHAERNGWDLVGAFHSHPSGVAFPSATDRRQALEPDWLYVIVGPVMSVSPEVRGFRIDAGVVTEQSLEIG
jgi:proteasome lid subunit RPN8/RPN11